MKKVMISFVKIIVILALVVFGIYGIQFLFVMGVDMSKERALVKQCKSYAEQSEVTYIGIENAFTYQGNTNHAVCRIVDLYEKMVFINEDNKLLVERNARSYRFVDAYDTNDARQSYTLSLHNGEPVYVHKKIDSNRLQIAYYSFDRLSLLFEVDSEE